MVTDTIKRGLPAMHPGELLREDIIPALDKPKTEIAKLLGISRQTLYEILGEKQPVTVAMALRFGKLIGNGPVFWLTSSALTISNRPSARLMFRPFRR